MKFIFFGILLFVFSAFSNLMAVTRYSVATGNWGSTSTWSANSGGNGGASVPVAGDVVYIEGGRTVTIRANAACTNVSIASGSTLTVNGYNFTVSGTITVSGNIIHTSTSATKSMGNVVLAGGTWTSNAAEAYSINSLTLSGGSIAGNSTGVFNVSSNLIVTATTSTTLNASTINVSGTTTINGTIVFASSNGTKLFVGATTVASGGVWDNDNVNEAITFRGGLTNNGTFYAGNSQYTFDTYNQTVAGVVGIPNLRVTGVTLTNTGTLTVAAALSGTGGLTNSGSGILNIGGTSGIYTFTASASGNTVNYSGNAQTCRQGTYHHLSFSGSGAKTFPTGITTVNGVFSIENSNYSNVFTGTLAYGTNATLRYNTTLARQVSNEWPTPFAASGGVVIAGSGVISSNGSKVFSASVPLTISASASLNTGNNQFTFGGNFINNGGTFTAGSSPIVIADVMTSQQIAGFTTTGAVSMTKTSGTATLGGAVSASALTVSEGTLDLGAGLSHVFTGNVTINGGSTSVLTSGANTNLSLGGNWNLNGSSVFTPGTGAVIFNGGSVQTIGGSASTSFNHLTISNGAGVVLGIAQAVNGTLTLSTGRLTLGAFNLTLGASSPAVAGTLNAGNMIVATGTGELRKVFSSNGAYLFPVGDAVATAEYSPINVTFASGTYAAGAYAAVKVANVKHPNNSSSSNYLNRYWTVSQSGISVFSATVSASYLTADIAGVETGQVAARYGGSLPWVKYASLGSNTLAASGLTSFGDFSGINNVPAITTSVALLTGFSYPVGYGPSGERSFTVSGNDLSANISVVPSAHFEISAGTGASFVATDPVVLAASGGSVTAASVYVRMKPGLPLGAVSAENVVVSTTGTTVKNVACSGTVSTEPNVLLSTSTLAALNYTFTAGPSTPKSFLVSGVDLVADVIITSPVNFEISKSPTTGFTSGSVTLFQSGGVLSSTPVYVRTKIALGVGDYSGSVVASSLSSLPKSVLCSGTVAPAPTVLNTVSSLSAFVYTYNAGPSSVQSFTVSGTALTNNLLVTPPANFEISTSPGSGFQSTTLSLVPVSGVVALTTIYVRLRSGLPTGDYFLEGIALSSTGASTKNISCSGSVVSSNRMACSKTTLTGFGYLFSAGGPSAPQSFTVSGTSLSANIVVTPPTNFQISSASAGPYQSTPITLSHSGGVVNATLIYVRLKAGLPAGDYPSENIVLTSTNSSTINISCHGVVFISPLITAGGGGSVCAGSTVNLTSTGADIQNRYWQGPSSFYSLLQNPSLSNSTPTMSGTYTVTGNVTVGGNLVTNGDFELGNTSFGSSYGYTAPAYNSLWNEGLYTVVADPSSTHTNFSHCSDHSSVGSKQMVVNGAGTAGVVIWTQSVPVIPGADYEFTYWVQSVVAESPSQLQLYVNGVSVGPVYTANLDTCSWKQFAYNANAGASSVFNLELINQNTALSGNDFALDDIVFQQILPAVSSVSVTVNQNLAVGVSIAASANPVFSGTPVTFTATPVNGGMTPSYQWKLNGANVGTNSATYTNSSLITGSIVSCVMTSNVLCPTGNPATASSITMTVNPRINFWKGTVDTDWSKAANWTAGFVPSTGDDVEFATVANNGGVSASNDLQLDADRTIGSLINATTKSLIIPPSKGLTVNNAIATDGVADRIYIQSSSSTPNGSLIFAQPSLNTTVSASVEMYSKASWDDTAAENNRLKWQYFGIPLKSLVANPTFAGSHVRRWDETGTSIANHWVPLVNESSLFPFLGYELCQAEAKTFVFKGILETGNFSSGALAYTTTALYPGQHIFANPYAAAIDITHLTNSFGTNMEAAVYLYNTGTYNDWLNVNHGESTPGNGAGQYTVSTPSSAGSGGVPAQIPSMQAFLVKAISNNPSNSTLSFNYSSVVAKNSERQRMPSVGSVSSVGKAFLRIDVSGERFSDRMWIFTAPECSRAFDNGWDGRKLFGSKQAPQLFAIESDGEYQINSVDDMNNTQLGFKPGDEMSYTFSFTHENLIGRYAGIYLYDAVARKTIDVTASGTEYSFFSDPVTVNEKRFKIVARPYEKDAVDTDTQVKVFGIDRTIFIHNFGNSEGEVYLYDLFGRFLQKVSFSDYTITTLPTRLSTGWYVVKVVTNNEEIIKRILIR